MEKKWVWIIVIVVGVFLIWKSSSLFTIHPGYYEYFQGFVTSSADGKPVQGIKVYLETEEGSAVFTDANGWYHIEVLQKPSFGTTQIFYNKNRVDYTCINKDWDCAVRQVNVETGYGAIQQIDITLTPQFTCNTPADTDCSGLVSRTELGNFITLWVGGQATRTDLGNAIMAWVRG